MDINHPIQIKTRILHKNGASIVIMSALIAGTLMAIFLGQYLQQPALGVGLVAATLFGLFFCLQKIKLHFVHPIVIKLDSEGAYFIEYTRGKNGMSEKNSSFRWDEVSSYRIITNEATLTRGDLILKFIIGKKGKPLILVGEGVFDKVNVNLPSPTLSLFLDYINAYNSKQDPESIIELKPGFFATQSGQYFLNFFGVLIAFDILYRLTHYGIQTPSSYITLFISATLYLGMLGRKKIDRKLYDFFNSI